MCFLHLWDSIQELLISRQKHSMNPRPFFPPEFSIWFFPQNLTIFLSFYLRWRYICMWRNIRWKPNFSLLPQTYIEILEDANHSENELFWLKYFGFQKNRGVKEAVKRGNFKVSNWKLSLVAHCWKGLFKTMILFKLILHSAMIIKEIYRVRQK